MKLRNLLLTGVATTMMAATVVTASPVFAESIVKETNTKDDKKTEVKLENGDNLWQLAKDYDVNMEDIVKANDLDSVDTVIKPDQKLIIPGLQTLDAKARKAQRTTTSVVTSNTSVAKKATTTTSTVVKSATPARKSTPTYSVSGGEAAAKEWIAMRESGGSYSARNGIFIGRYQLSSALLGGDYSPANQERVAHNYVYGRYGSWQGAKSFWLSHGWY